MDLNLDLLRVVEAFETSPENDEARGNLLCHKIINF